jgi:cation transport ATPase
MHGKTIAEFSAIHGIKTDTIRKRWKTAFPEIPFSIHTEINPETESIIFGKRKTAIPSRSEIPNNLPESGNNHFVDVRKMVAPAPERSERKTTPAPAAKKSRLTLEQVRSAVFMACLVLIVFGHAVLVWYDCSQLWGMAGIIGGCMAFLIVSAAFLLSLDPAQSATSSTAVFFVALVDIAAWFTHYPVFSRQADNIGDVQTKVVCGFICALSFAALYLIREQKLNKWLA